LKQKNISTINELYIDSTEVCPECKQSNFISKRGDIICPDCGLVIMDETLDPKGGERKPDIHTEVPKFPIGTIIRGSQDAFRKKLSPFMKSQFDRFQRFPNIYGNLSKEERRIVNANSFLERFFESLKIIKPIKEEAERIFARILKEINTRGKSFETLALATIYIACKIKKKPMKINKILEIVSIEKGKISRYSSTLIRELNLKVLPSDPEDYIESISGELGILRETQIKALEILSNTNNQAGKDPSGLAGGALYLAGILNSDKKTQEQMAEAAGVSEVTIRTRYKELKNFY